MEPVQISNSSGSPKTGSAWLFWILIAALIVCLGRPFYLKYVRAPQSGRADGPHAAAPVLGQVGNFSLIERDGRRVTLDTLRGRVWIADFFFASCAGTCPVMTGRMRMLNDELARHFRDEVLLVSVSVDPARDTPSALRAYAIKHGVPASRWLFLTGDKAQMETMAVKSFKLGSPQAVPGEDQILHSERFFLVDREGRIRGSYGAITPQEEDDLLHVPMDRGMPENEKRRLMTDIESVMGESQRR